jgi:hypothetical protein
MADAIQGGVVKMLFQSQLTLQFEVNLDAARKRE